MITFVGAITHYARLRRSGYAASTWKAHRSALARFGDWVIASAGEDVPLEDIDATTMVDYTDRFRPPTYAASTFNGYCQMLRLFFDHCRREGWIQRDPMRYVRPARVGRRLRRQLTASECLRMLELAGERDRIGLALGMTTALRASDIAALTVADVNLDAGYVFARIRKTVSEDRMPITADLDAALRRWFEHYAAVMSPPDGILPGYWTLVPPAHWEADNVWDPCGPGRVVYMVHRHYAHPQEIVQRGLSSIGHPTHGEGFHTLRRTAARLVHDVAVAEGIDNPLRVTQAFLGHQSQATTERYVQIGREQIARDRLLRGRRLLGHA